MSKQIEYPKLKKIGGLKNFAKGGLLKILAILLIAVLSGYLGGHTVQQSFRELTGYKYEKVASEEEKEEVTMLPTDNRFQEEGSLLVNILEDTMNMASNALNVIRTSEPFEKMNEVSLEIILTILSPLFFVLDWAAFWFSFAIFFILGGWLASKLINFERHIVTGGVDPAVIKNIEILEAKVKELVDQANQKKSS